jgi:hypothetical protein
MFFKSDNNLKRHVHLSEPAKSSIVLARMKVQLTLSPVQPASVKVVPSNPTPLPSDSPEALGIATILVSNPPVQPSHSIP